MVPIQTALLWYDDVDGRPGPSESPGAAGVSQRSRLPVMSLRARPPGPANLRQKRTARPCQCRTVLFRPALEFPQRVLARAPRQRAVRFLPRRFLWQRFRGLAALAIFRPVLFGDAVTLDRSHWGCSPPGR